jgi:hypothetical protein
VRRSLILPLTAAAAVALLAVGVGVSGVASAESSTAGKPGAAAQLADASDEEPAPVFPRPGGGPRAIHAFVSLAGTQTYLLDVTAGEYRRLPYVSIRLSPDGRLAAVEAETGEIGVAERGALLRAGEAAVRWTTLPPGSMTGWSPDGRALLTTTLDKTLWEFTAHRYDVTTGRLSHTPIRLACDVCTAGWAGDSTRYVIQLRGADPEIPDGPMQYLNPDGTPGPLVGLNGHIWDAQAYSPNRRYVIVEPSRPVEVGPEWTLPRIFDLATGRVLPGVATEWPLLGWYDNSRVVRVAMAATPGDPTVLEVVDIHTGTVVKRVPAPGLPAAIIQLGSGWLPAPAAAYGF